MFRRARSKATPRFLGVRDFGAGREWRETKIRLLVGLSFVLGFAVVLSFAGDKPAEKPQTIRLVIDYNDTVEKHFTAVPWKTGLTVLDAMTAAKGMPHGITFTQTGSGETAFVTQIDDLKNEGNRGGHRNWTFRLNGKLSDRGVGVCPLKAGDVVKWVYSEKGLD